MKKEKMINKLQERIMIEKTEKYIKDQEEKIRKSNLKEKGADSKILYPINNK